MNFISAVLNVKLTLNFVVNGVLITHFFEKKLFKALFNVFINSFNFREIQEFIIIIAPLYSTGISTNKFSNFKIVLILFHSHEKYTYCFYTHVFFLCALTGSYLGFEPICNLSLFRCANEIGTTKAMRKKNPSFNVKHTI